jgi:formylglycine-generating enzyme required for sulfatase activity
MLQLAALMLLLSPVPAGAVIEWVPIGDPGNESDSQPAGSFGSVDYEYSMSKFEVTNAEYASFLNAKAASDPLGLYSPSMESDFLGGILRMGTPGTYSYGVKDGFADKPVNFVTFFDALRFANWIENGEGNGSTETGAYTLLGGTETPSNGSTVERNPDAEVVVPTQDEWFKAAYYDGDLGVYYDYPAGTDDVPTCSSPTAVPNRASCGDLPLRGLTEVGAYTGSPSPYGTFDQGGNVSEWNEDIINALSGTRANRGGGWTGLTTPLKASSAGPLDPNAVNNARGFRLALLAVPEPDAAALGIAALASLGLLAKRRSPIR